ncbi:uncharacterized protein ACLA_082720 [Aspergillus clavatus NRRL 1]|uniref:Uncharacterized protein n=1 Tax=Aspergillus clavatus (strain ATCC 1007 / CBS 513.65 / DSM 816 / NCTC 3887 / NRRL 1 / QM 1276 / 107) TaxID=344612 RepID=A1CTE4_ASPCL|nr:uncharacterized protein ACLA_082720 [Aspergillus clavatus NRRL 1]EAW06581.1 hypothetical protein ACLA_082720 [Aspergillus clavatus NRRL 1]
MSDSIHVYTGPWVNWSHGLYRGATLTLSQEYAGLLTAFLALFVSFAGTMMWRILCFVIHQACTTRPSERRDFLHHTRQVILRNSSSGAGAAWTLTWLAWTVGRKTPRALLRIVPLLFLALLLVASFGVAGVFTGYVTKVPGNTTVILGPHCGGFTLNVQANSTLLSQSVVLSKSLEDTIQAATYADQCYQGSFSLTCGTYARQRLPFTTNANASCPFERGLCIANDQSAFAMDTGLLDSNDDFGINSRPDNRVKYRRLTTCAPIYGSSFVNTRNDSDSGPIVYVNAGSIPALAGVQNWTFSHTTRVALDDVDGYTLKAIYSQADSTGILHNEGTMWFPDPSLNRTDADLTLMMLAQNSVNYVTPSDDPWMPAHVDLNVTYMGDYYVNLLGCIDQYQFCNPNLAGDAGCTKLGGIHSVAQDMILRNQRLSFSEDQATTIGRFLSAADYRSMYYAVQGRGGSALNIAQKLYNNFQYYVPRNQWQIEVSNWFAASLAKEQAWAVEWATSPQNFASRQPGEKEVWEYNPVSTVSGQHQCRNQLVHSNGEYKSLSILGMALTLAVGGLIIVTGLFLDIVVGFFQRKKWLYLREQWEMEETLALHKAVYQSIGFSPDANEDLPPSSALRDRFSTTDYQRTSAVGKPESGLLTKEQDISSAYA